MNNMIGNALMLGGIYLGNKIKNKNLRYGLFGIMAYSLYRMNKNNSLSGGWKFEINPGMAVDMLFPSMGEAPKMLLKNVAQKIADRINL